jgi:nucleoside phosphorylase
MFLFSRPEDQGARSPEAPIEIASIGAILNSNSSLRKKVFQQEGHSPAAARGELQNYPFRPIILAAIAALQVALQQAVAKVTRETGAALKRRLRTGAVVTNDDRNWELRWSKERRLINISRAIAVDMESATIATQGFRMRAPYGTRLCVSDKPLHGEIKLPGAANAFYERAIGEHLQIGLAAIDLLQSIDASLHSRKLRSFDEPSFRRRGRA